MLPDLFCSPIISPPLSPWELTYMTSAVTPVPLPLRDDDDLSALGFKRNVCMNPFAALISAKLESATVPAQSGSKPFPPAPCASTHVWANDCFPIDSFNQRTGSF